MDILILFFNLCLLETELNSTAFCYEDLVMKTEIFNFYHLSKKKFLFTMHFISLFYIFPTCY